METSLEVRRGVQVLPGSGSDGRRRAPRFATEVSFKKRRLSAMAEGAPSGKRPGRASARLVARAEAALPPLIRFLAGDLLHAVTKLLADADLPCFRLACKAFRDHSSPAQEMRRTAFLRTRALVVFAWRKMTGFIATLPAMLILAASVGCEDVLEELVDNRDCVPKVGACAAAAENGQLGALVWLRSRGCPWNYLMTCRAAYGGHLEVLRYAHEHGCPWGIATCYRAAEGGHLEVLRYAHEHGCPWDSYTCWCAAEGGHLEVLRYAHEHGCPWDCEICERAADGGHLEVLRYAHEHGCPWDYDTCERAAEGGHLEVLRYALEHGCPLSAWELDYCRALALAGGHTEVVEYLHAAQPTEEEDEDEEEEDGDA
jgi:hypothetical protein